MIDEFAHCSGPDAVVMANKLAAKEGLLVGPSSGITPPTPMCKEFRETQAPCLYWRMVLVLLNQWVAFVGISPLALEGCQFF